MLGRRVPKRVRKAERVEQLDEVLEGVGIKKTGWISEQKKAEQAHRKLMQRRVPKRVRKAEREDLLDELYSQVRIGRSDEYALTKRAEEKYRRLLGRRVPKRERARARREEYEEAIGELKILPLDYYTKEKEAQLAFEKLLARRARKKGVGRERLSKDEVFYKRALEQATGKKQKTLDIKETMDRVWKPTKKSRPKKKPADKRSQGGLVEVNGQMLVVLPKAKAKVKPKPLKVKRRVKTNEAELPPGSLELQAIFADVSKKAATIPKSRTKQVSWGALMNQLISRSRQTIKPATRMGGMQNFIVKQATGIKTKTEIKQAIMLASVFGSQESQKYKVRQRQLSKVVQIPKTKMATRSKPIVQPKIRIPRIKRRVDARYEIKVDKSRQKKKRRKFGYEDIVYKFRGGYL